jgi:hypothetical protein
MIYFKNTYIVDLPGLQSFANFLLPNDHAISPFVIAEVDTHKVRILRVNNRSLSNNLKSRATEITDKQRRFKSFT